VIRDYLPDQHREFFAQLPFVLLGTTDKAGRPWASLLVGLPVLSAQPTLVVSDSMPGRSTATR
jgi:predicted pyridoxine 5'-phosphate oxidase superfamily flavin-nucleotide-binding protein